MGSTPRERTTQIPLPTRSTEAGTDCYGRIVLSYLRSEDERPASFFILGDVLHRAIEYAINEDADLADTLGFVDATITQELKRVGDTPIVEGSGRNVASMLDDGERMITNWFSFVHPASKHRHPFYDKYQWPPTTEVTFYNDSLGTRFPVWGSIDAVFEAKAEEAINYDTGSGLAIVDWKSGVKRPGSQFQLDYYRFGADKQEAVAAYHMLDRVRTKSIVLEADPFPGETAIRESISVAERAKQATIAGQMPKFSPSWQCGYCTVQHVCPADGDPRNRSKNEKQLIRILSKAEAMTEILDGNLGHLEERT